MGGYTCFFSVVSAENTNTFDLIHSSPLRTYSICSAQDQRIKFLQHYLFDTRHQFGFSGVKDENRSSTSIHRVPVPGHIPVLAIRPAITEGLKDRDQLLVCCSI